MVAMFIPETPAYAIIQGSGEAVRDRVKHQPGASRCPWNPGPRKAKAGGYRVQLPDYIVRLCQNRRSTPVQRDRKNHRPGTGWWASGMGVTSVESCKWREEVRLDPRQGDREAGHVWEI